MTSADINALYVQVNDYILQNFVLFWAIIIGILAIIGVALYFIAKAVAEKGVRQSISEFQTRMNISEAKNKELLQRINNLSAVPDEIPLCLPAGFSAIPEHLCHFTKAANGLTLVYVAVQKSDASNLYNGTFIAILPCGYRPNSTVSIKDSSGGYIEARADGNIVYFGDNSTNWKTAIGTLVFFASAPQAKLYEHPTADRPVQYKMH